MRTTALLSFCLVVAASLSCCSSPETDSAHRDLVLRLYEVPHGLASDIRSVLRETLRVTEGYEQRSTVSVAPGGKLLVLAEPQVQAGIENLIRSLDAAPPAASLTLEMSYWLVAGRSVSETVAGSSTIPPELVSALGSVVEALGPMEFALIERVQLASRSDSRATADGSFVTIHQTASLVEGRVVAFLEISSKRGGNRLATEVYLEPDQIVVLAQTNISEPGRMPDFFSDREGSQQPNVLIYVVRATVQG